MKKAIFPIILIAAACCKTFAQIDCKPASGILALTVAPVIINPTDPDDLGGDIITFKGQTKIFRNPPATIPATCLSSVKMFVFYSASQPELGRYPNLGKQDQTALFNKPHSRVTLTGTDDPNIKNCSAQIGNNNYVEGQVVYYRWAKLIDHPTDVDPVAWSDIMSFTVLNTPLKFDVELELDQMIVANVKDFDGTEDLIGKISFYSAKALSKFNDTEKILWEHRSEHFSVGPGTYKINKRVSVLKGLSVDELKHMELTVFANINDADIGTRPFFAVEYNHETLLARVLKFKGFPTTQASINALQPNGEFQDLRFGDDKTFEMNFYESKKKENGWVKLQFKVWVKPYR